MSVEPPSLSGRIVEAAIVRRPIPLRRPLRGSRGPVVTRSIRLLRLTADDGTVGLGEGSSVDWLSATPATADAPLFRALGETVRRETPLATELLEWTIEASGPSSLRAALQTALFDLEARRRGISLAALLGATDPDPVFTLSALLGDDTPDAMAREASRLAALGLTSFKIKVGRSDLAEDVARATAVRAVIGGAKLRIDANSAWNLGDAGWALHALAAAGAEFVEEPLADRAAIVLLRSAIPVALDESVRNLDDLELAIARGGFGVLVLKLERVGGPLVALAMAERAARAGIEVVFTDSIESVVGQVATVHVAAAACSRAGVKPAAIGLGGLFLLDDGDDPRPAMAVKGPGLGLDIPRALGIRPS